MQEHKRIKECAAMDCSVIFQQHRHPNGGWTRQKYCSDRCQLRARYERRAYRDAEKQRNQRRRQYITEHGQRRSMPRWAALWEERRRAEDLAELAIVPVVYGRGAQRITSKPRTRQFIAGWCPDCGAAVSVIRGWWHDSIRCSSCTKRRWQQNHKQRAQMRGVEYEDINPAAVFARDKRRCQLCGLKTRGKYPAPTSATIDHIVPLSKGGPHLLHNLQTACLRCNVKKYNRAANDQMRLAV